MIAAFVKDRARLLVALAVLAAVGGVVMRVGALEASLKSAREERDAARGAGLEFARELAVERRAANALASAVKSMAAREARVQPIIIEAREAIANAPETNTCARSPAIGAALDGVLRLESADDSDSAGSP